MDEDSPWLCTQVVVVNDDRPDDGEEKSNDFGCIVLSDMNDNECYVLQEGDNTIGRHPLNNIFIEHPSVSMNHAVIQCDSDGVVLSDKGSLNKTRLNKKILKKAVAYFLDENALLMFGEVRAKYFVDSNSYNTTNESKSNESNDNTVEKKIGNDDTPLLKLTNTVVISDSSTGHYTNCSTSLVNKNNSINEKISEVNTKQKNINGHIDNICSVSNSSNSSDAFLLDAVSQIEEITDLTEQTPVKTYGNSTDETLNNSLRENTPSPVMDLGISLSNQFSTMSKVSTDESQSLKCMNEGNEREDTPSPVMDLGIFSYSDNKMYTPATNNYDIHSTNESTKKIDGLDETQILEVKEHPSSLINQFDTNEPNLLNECTQLPIMDDKCLPNTQTQKAQCLSINVEGRSSLLDMQSNKNKCDETSMETQHFKLNDNDFFDRPTQKCSTSNSSVSFNQSINQTDNEIKKKLDIFEEDDDDIFLCLDDKAEFNDRSKIMKINLSKTNLEKTTDTKQVTSNSNNINLPEGKFNRINEVHSDDFFDCPTQKLSTSKHSHCTIKDDVPKQNVIEKKINTFEADDDDIFSSFIQEESKSQSYISTSLKDDDFYNCPTQKLSIDKHFNITTEKSSTKHQKSIQQFLKPGVSSINTSKIHTSSIHEEETQKFHKHSQPVVSDLSNSKNFTSPINNDITQIPEMDDDFFNRPTQKLPITKKKNSKVNPTIHEEETQKLKECSQPIVLKTTNDKACTSSLHDDLTQVPEMDDDFFNCPTQKMSIINKINSKASSTIHKEETQELSKLGVPVTSISRNCTSRINNDITQIPEMDDDFFNRPTQKLPITKKKNSKVNPTIHEEETQKLKECSQPIVLKTTNDKACTSSLHDDLTQVPEMDDDFFNCPTQKMSIIKKINSKASSTIHEEETQELPKLGVPVTSISRNCTSRINNDLNQVPEMDDDFFNCPTQKYSNIKKINSKVNSTINEEETQKLEDFPKLIVPNTTNAKTCTSSTDNDLTQAPEMDDDFFNCPTQKYSNMKTTGSKVNSTIHEEETQKPEEFRQPVVLNTKTTFRTSKSNTHDDLTQIPELDDEDFFNCATQKISLIKKLNSKVNPTINEEETQKLQKHPQHVELNRTNSKACTSSTHNDYTHVPEMDDFFNCPTQKISTNKKINSRVDSTIHEEETQELPKPGVSGTSISRNCTSRINNDLNQVPEMDDDFFNCPTQKYSNIKKINLKVNSTIHEEETQTLEDFPQPIVLNTTNAKTCTSSTDDDLTQAPEMDDDFFNCPTQKYSNMKTTGSKVNSTIHEEETQKLEEFRQPVVLNTKTTFRTSKSNIHDDLTQIPEPDDEDFFNCATQKVSIIKKLDSKVSSTINEEETQKLPDFSKTNVSNTRITGTDVTRMNDLTREPVIEDDFFNCPTQKISNVWKTNLKVNSSIKETQNIPKHGYQSISTLKTGTTSTSKSPTNVPELDDEDFFNQPTQKLASDVKPSSDLKKNKTIVSNINEAQTQKLPNQSEPNISTSSKSVLTNHCEKIYPIFDNNDGRKSLRQKRTVVSSNTDDSKIRKSLRIDSQKNSKLSEKPPVICKQNQNSSKSPKTSKKPLIQVRKDLCAPIPKSECLNNKSPSNTNKSVSNSMLNNTQSVNKPINSPRRSKIIENNLSRVSVKQEPLNNDSPNNTESVNKPINSPRRSKIIENNLSRVSVKREPLNNDSPNNTQSVNKRINSPRRSKIIENNLSRVSVKREPLNNDSTGQVLNNTLLKLQSEQFNETAVFSPLNIPNLSANSSLEQYLTSTPDVDSSSSSSKQSSSSSVASKWQSFWNKKKMACQNKGSTDGTKKERYQTRANTKKENIPECSRKRKQGDSIDFDESNKRLCDRVKKRMSNPLNESTSETVVTFSYLRNRHLQEMKQFIERTRGFVTDDVTQCTVLVTDKIRCTMKTLSAIARGCPIVDANWVKHSYTVQMFQDVDEFILADKDTERKYKFRLKESLARARAKKLLDGYTVLVTPSVKPGPKEMKVIITCAGGDYVMNWPKTRVQKGLIVTCDQDCRRWKSMWDNDAAKKIDCDTLVMSIVRQKLNLDS